MEKHYNLEITGRGGLYNLSLDELLTHLVADLGFIVPDSFGEHCRNRAVGCSCELIIDDDTEIKIKRVR